MDFYLEIRAGDQHALRPAHEHMLFDCRVQVNGDTVYIQGAKAIGKKMRQRIADALTIWHTSTAQLAAEYEAYQAELNQLNARYALALETINATRNHALAHVLNPLPRVHWDGACWLVQAENEHGGLDLTLRTNLETGIRHTTHQYIRQADASACTCAE